MEPLTSAAAGAREEAGAQHRGLGGLILDGGVLSAAGDLVQRSSPHSFEASCLMASGLQPVVSKEPEGALEADRGFALGVG
jgi:hypothetical protein